MNGVSHSETPQGMGRGTAAQQLPFNRNHYPHPQDRSTHPSYGAHDGGLYPAMPQPQPGIGRGTLVQQSPLTGTPQRVPRDGVHDGGSYSELTEFQWETGHDAPTQQHPLDRSHPGVLAYVPLHSAQSSNVHRASSPYRGPYPLGFAHQQSPAPVIASGSQVPTRVPVRSLMRYDPICYLSPHE